MQAERKQVLASTRIPDLDNANVGKICFFKSGISSRGSPFFLRDPRASKAVLRSGPDAEKEKK